jgi:hypothetical protein
MTPLESLQLLIQEKKCTSSPIEDIAGGHRIRVTAPEGVVTVSFYDKSGKVMIQPTGRIAWLDEWKVGLQPTRVESADPAISATDSTIWRHPDPEVQQEIEKWLCHQVPGLERTKENTFQMSRGPSMTVQLYPESVRINGKNSMIHPLIEKLNELQLQKTLQQIGSIETPPAGLRERDWDRFCQSLEDQGYELRKKGEKIYRKEAGEGRFEIFTEQHEVLARFEVQDQSYRLDKSLEDLESDVVDAFNNFSIAEGWYLLASFNQQGVQTSTQLIAVCPTLFRWLQKTPLSERSACDLLPQLQKQHLCSRCFSDRVAKTGEGSLWKEIGSAWDRAYQKLLDESPEQVIHSFHFKPFDPERGKRSHDKVIPETLEEGIECYPVFKTEMPQLFAGLDSLKAIQTEDEIMTDQ